jgi:Flp pilus assembly pilin Flp
MTTGIDKVGACGASRRNREVPAMTEMLLRPYIKAQTTIAALRDGEEGQTITEYALIIASIAVLLIVAMLFLAGKVDNLFSDTGSSVESPGPLPS